MDGPTIAFMVLAAAIASLRSVWWWRSERRRTRAARKPAGQTIVVRDDRPATPERS